MPISAPNVKFASYKAPFRPEVQGVSVFVAGSIEMGKAIEWQTEFTAALEHLSVTVFNPRRDDWDKSWKQDISNLKFTQQVEWEMDYLEKADVIALFFQPETSSPISLLELGLHASGGKLVVCCPEGFWRRGNVQVVCHRFGVPLVETLEELKAVVKEKLESFIKETK